MSKPFQSSCEEISNELDATNIGKPIAETEGPRTSDDPRRGREDLGTPRVPYRTRSYDSSYQASDSTDTFTGGAVRPEFLKQYGLAFLSELELENLKQEVKRKEELVKKFEQQLFEAKKEHELQLLKEQAKSEQKILKLEIQVLETKAELAKVQERMKRALKEKPYTEDDDSTATKPDGTSLSSENVIGKGSNGNLIYKYWDENLGTTVALKKMNKMHKPEDVAIQMREYKNLLTSAHQYILKAIRFTHDENFCYLITELCAGSLDKYIEGPLLKDFPVLKKVQKERCFNLELLRKIMEGVHFLHSNDIVHRDLKPQNILLLIEGESVTPKIADFGLSKEICGEETVTSGVSGTIQWTAPEMLEGNTKRKGDLKVDIFTMGLVIHYTLFGVHPFGENTITRPSNILAGESIDLNEYDFLTSRLIKEMINEDPTQRPSAGEVRAHCMFWSEDKQMRFFEIVRGHFPHEKNAPTPLSRRALYSLNCQESEFRKVALPNEDFHCSLGSPLTISEKGGEAAVVLLNWKCCDDFYIKATNIEDCHGLSARQLIRYLRNMMIYGTSEREEVMGDRLKNLKETKRRLEKKYGVPSNVEPPCIEDNSEDNSGGNGSNGQDKIYDIKKEPYRAIVLRYILAWFPNLLVHTYSVVKKFYRKEEVYAEFFEAPNIDHTMKVPDYL